MLRLPRASRKGYDKLALTLDPCPLLLSPAQDSISTQSATKWLPDHTPDLNTLTLPPCLCTSPPSCHGPSQWPCCQLPAFTELSATPILTFIPRYLLMLSPDHHSKKKAQTSYQSAHSPASPGTPRCLLATSRPRLLTSHMPQTVFKPSMLVASMDFPSSLYKGEIPSLKRPTLP